MVRTHLLYKQVSHICIGFILISNESPEFWNFASGTYVQFGSLWIGSENNPESSQMHLLKHYQLLGFFFFFFLSLDNITGDM